MKLRWPTREERVVRWWVVAPPLLLLVAFVSVEDVRSDPEPLDQRFYSGARSGPGGMSEQQPFADYEGDTVTLSGLLKAPRSGAVEMDLWQPDPSAPGSRTHLGKLPGTSEGQLRIEVPVSFGQLQIEAFQDLTGDGPSADDPFGQLQVEVGDADQRGIELVLEEGAFAAILAQGAGPGGGADPEHVEAAPGTPVADQAEGALGGAPAAPPLPFADYEGPTVALSGVIQAPADLVVDLDLWQVDTAAPGSRTHLGKVSLHPGAFSLDVPSDLGALQLEAFQDLTRDGPSGDDPFGRLELEIAESPVTGANLLLQEGELAALLAVGAGPSGANGAAHAEASPGAPGGDAAAGTPAEAPTGSPPLQPPPFADYEGPTVALSGHIRAPTDALVDLDLWQVDPAAPGSRTHLGKISMKPGVFSIDVPANHGPMELEAFQDLTANGPSVDDPFVRTAIEGGGAPVEGLDLSLVVGGLAASSDGQLGSQGGAHVHQEAPPGAPGGDTTSAPGGAVAHPDPFSAVAGPRVTISGTIVYDGAHALLDMDIFQIEPSVQGGRAFVGKQKVGAGAFSVNLPVSFGEVDLEVFLDRDGDGPTPGDPFASCPANPISLKKGDVKGLEIEVTEAQPATEPTP